MVIVPNQLYSFHCSQVAGFKQLYDLARQHSYAPIGCDGRSYEMLTPDDPLFARRDTLGDLPNEEAILQRELELAQPKGVHATTAVARDVETPVNRQFMDALPPPQLDAQTSPAPGELHHRKMKFRSGSGYVKLDDRKLRMPELISQVSEFFGAPCRCQGDYWYPPGGFRDWHTNKYDKAGWRLYIVDVDVRAQSYFRIKHPRTHEIVTLWDQPGTFNFFLIDPARLLWHCIGAERCNRWSKGFVIPDTWLDTLAAKQR